MLSGADITPAQQDGQQSWLVAVDSYGARSAAKDSKLKSPPWRALQFFLQGSGGLSDDHALRRHRRRESRLGQGLANHLVALEIDLPVVVVVAIRAHRQHLADHVEIENLRLNAGCAENIRN